jgi:hypothetical protein
VLTTPVANLPLVLLIPMAICPGVIDTSGSVVDTGGKFAADVIDTGDNFATGVIDTGGAP